MANYRAITNGNWSTLAIWEDDGTGSFVASSVLPGVVDDVWCNSFTITVTSDIIFNTIKKDYNAGLSITQGGQIILDGTSDITVVGNSYGYTSGALPSGLITNPIIYRPVSHTGILNIIGNIYGGSQYGYGFINDSINELNIIGDLTGGFSNHAYCLWNKAVCTLRITGNCYGGSGGNVSSCYGLYNATASDILITGDIYGGSTNGTTYGVYNTGGIISFIIIGNIYATSWVGFYNGAPNTLISITGNLYANLAAAVENSHSTSIFEINGNVYNHLSFMAVVSNQVYLNVTPTTVWEWSDFGGNSQYLVAENAVTGMPSEADVRKDEVYGTVGGLTGTLAVPPPSTVNEGVPTDDTVGTGTNGLTTTILTRLENCATAEIVASIIKAMK